MTLGEKLKTTIQNNRLKNEKAERGQKLKELEKEEQQRKDLEHWLTHIQDSMVASINAGKIPTYNVHIYDRQSWLTGCVTPNTVEKNQDLWDNFRDFWKNEDLELTVKHSHDGMGMKSWLVLELRPVG